VLVGRRAAGTSSGGKGVNTSSRRGARRSPLLAAAIATLLAVPASAAPPAGKPSPPQDQFVVRFKDGSAEHRNAQARQRALERVARASGVRIGEVRRLAVGASVIRTGRPLDEAQAKALIGHLRANPQVEYAEPDVRSYPAVTPTDPYYPNQWHYFEATGGINAPAAWDLASALMPVAVLDTGVTAHPDVPLRPGWDFVSDAANARDGNGRDSDPSDPGDWTSAYNECGDGKNARNSTWHGTHVSGTVAAMHNGIGVSGVARGGDVTPIRVLGKCGGTSSDIADAIVWASGGAVGGVPANVYYAQVINLSLGGPGACPAVTQAAINTANANGAVVVVAAGNANIDVANFQPANCANVVTVGANGRDGARSYFSNYGALIDVAAPGGGGGGAILSTGNAGATTPTTNTYTEMLGTSMAAPHVSGIAALAYAAGEASGTFFTPAQMEALLKSTTRAMPVACPQGCGTGIVDAQAAVMAAIDDPILFIRDAVAVPEGDSGNQTLSFALELSRAAAADVTVSMSTSNAGTATAGSDFTARSANVVIPAGQTSANFDVTVHGDTLGEDDESVEVYFPGWRVTGVYMTNRYARGTILNDDPFVLTPGVPWTGLADATVGHQRHFLMEVPANAANLRFALGWGDDASGDADLYVRLGAPPTYADWDCRPYLGGSAQEETCDMPAEAGTWHVMLDAYYPYSDATLVGTYDLPALAINDVSIAEGQAGAKNMNFTVSLSRAGAAAVTFDLATADGSATAGVDYTASGAVGLSIPAGTLAKSFSVPIAGDTAVEANETFVVNLANATGAVITDAQGIGTILNDDGVIVSIADVAIAEGHAGTRVATFVVQLNKTSPSPVAYDIATTDGTAIAGSDYVASALAGQTIPAGQISKVFSVALNGDTELEPNETFGVQLASVAGASVFDGQATGTILNDEGPTLSIGDRGYFEGNAGTFEMGFVVTLSQASPVPVTFDIATSNFTALNPGDYAGRSVTGLVIPAGALSRTFKVTTHGDAVVEPNEEFRVTLGNTSVSASDGQAVGRIFNDDGPILSITDASVTEGNSGTKVMTFTVNLSQASASPVTYSIATGNTTAAAGIDYVAASAVGETIPAGMTSKTFSVTIKGDTTVEANETFKVNLSNASVSMSDGQGIGTITNDD
jgi:serine protease